MSQNIQSVLGENRSFPPSEAFTARARIPGRAAYDKLCRDAAKDREGFWAARAQELLLWYKPFTIALDASNKPHYRWFTDGKLNVSANCLDRHLDQRGNRVAIIAEGERGDVRHITYRQLYEDVCRLANALKKLGVQSGDRVVILMPHVPEAVVAMQACARIGATHSVVFGGFSAQALRDRVEDAGAKIIITADGGHRGGKVIALKATCDEALSQGGKTVQRVIVLRRAENDVTMKAGRDVWWHDMVDGEKPECTPTWVEAEHPLFLLYTSGSTGRPKGIQHSSAGYLLGAMQTASWVFDMRDDDVFWCTADVGWVTGHTYIAYGPLALGATQVMYEGAPTVPNHGRFWDMCQRHGVTIFYTAPTAIRALMRAGESWPQKYDLSKLRLLGSVGEPINPEAWMWYHEHIGAKRCPIVDTWWQTETGCTMISPLPGAIATKPGSCTLPIPGIAVSIVDEEGNPITQPDVGGALVITEPWPSMIRGIWGDEKRFRDTYWGKFNGRYYVAGDGAHRDKDGYYWIMGRLDDVINVSGHRLGTMEIESALVAHPSVVEAAVVSRPHELKGEAVVAFVVPRGKRPGAAQEDQQADELRAWVTKSIGALARPDDIRFVDNLPKTRSGKIMRRLLKQIARGEDTSGDTSTLENPAILEQLRNVEE